MINWNLKKNIYERSLKKSNIDSSEISNEELLKYLDYHKKMWEFIANELRNGLHIDVLMEVITNMVDEQHVNKVAVLSSPEIIGKKVLLYFQEFYCNTVDPNNKNPFFEYNYACLMARIAMSKSEYGNMKCYYCPFQVEQGWNSGCMCGRYNRLCEMIATRYYDYGYLYNLADEIANMPVMNRFYTFPEEKKVFDRGIEKSDVIEEV